MTPYLSDPDCTLYHGDALACLRELPSESVDCACGCGQLVAVLDARGRPRRFKRGHNLRVDHPLHRPGVTNWWKDRKHTPEARAKLSVAASVPKPWLRGNRNGMAGRTGATNPNWRGGVSPERQRLYASAEWQRVARIIRVRDGGCIECGSAAATHVHHVQSFAEYPDLRLDPDNLVTLCREHHYHEHRKGVKP